MSDDTNIIRLQLETEIEEELLFMKKNHEEEVYGLQNQTTYSEWSMDLDAPKSQNLSKVIGDIQAQYDNWKGRSKKS